MRRILTLLLVLALIGVSAPDPASSESTAVQVGAAAGSAFGTMIYAPVKATFCILGGIGSGVTAIFSPPTAGKIAMATCGGARPGPDTRAGSTAAAVSRGRCRHGHARGLGLCDDEAEPARRGGSSAGHAHRRTGLVV